jgi:hypothetical protein
MGAPKGNQFAKGNPGGGRPSSYDKKFVKIAESLCRLGATDLEVADTLGIAVNTLYSWKAHHKEFSDALKNAKDSADDRVERSLYQRAVGYTFESEKIAINSAGDITRAPYREHVPPETGACAFWLKNRRKEHWRDRHEVEVGGVGDFERMNEHELRDFIAAEAKTLRLSAPGTEESPNQGIARGSGRLN